jgi:hypothetical protein
MTPQQTAAYSSPCLLAEETMDSRFKWLMRTYSLILTLNTGYE